jgi:hypothetical protein
VLVGEVREQQHDPEITKHLCQIFSQDTVEKISKTREKQRWYIHEKEKNNIENSSDFLGMRHHIVSLFSSPLSLG